MRALCLPPRVFVDCWACFGSGFKARLVYADFRYRWLRTEHGEHCKVCRGSGELELPGPVDRSDAGLIKRIEREPEFSITGEVRGG